MPSIEQKPSAPPREAGPRVRVPPPDFRNLGTLLRLLLGANVLALVTVIVRSDSAMMIPDSYLLFAGRLELPLIACALLLYLLGPRLTNGEWLPTVLLTVGTALLAEFGGRLLLPPDDGARWQGPLWAAGAALVLLAYFRYRQMQQTPALAEARMLALNARIRPHFFFNSLNGVLGVLRTDPRRAEAALEALADLFRNLMRDQRELVTLCDEIETCNRYLELERLRLGERLQVSWKLRHAPLQARVPPLMLQPLIENAVYHGIEPSTGPAEISIRIQRRGNRVDLLIANPVPAQARPSGGNRMALANIRERLALFFDLEARLDTEERDGRFTVRISLPLRLTQ